MDSHGDFYIESIVQETGLYKNNVLFILNVFISLLLSEWGNNSATTPPDKKEKKSGVVKFVNHPRLLLLSSCLGSPC